MADTKKEIIQKKRKDKQKKGEKERRVSLNKPLHLSQLKQG